MPYSCLIIEREAAETATSELPGYGFRPFVARTPESALAIARQWTFDAAIVDADSFGPGHVDVLRSLQPEFRSPILVLSQWQDEREQIRSLESGATEVLIKPASARLVAAKLVRLIELGAREADGDQVRLGPLAMHARRGVATVDGVALPLTVHEFELLFLLASRAGQFVDREAIALRLRGSAEPCGRSADVHVYRIRRKLKTLGMERLRLDTVYGRGYMLTLDSADGTRHPELAAPTHRG